MNLEKIHLIKSKDMCLSYYYPTADIRVINKETYDILSALKEYLCYARLYLKHI